MIYDSIFISNCNKSIWWNSVLDFRSIEKGVEYEYSVSAINRAIEGTPSPSATYFFEKNVCGDSRKDENEECDDGNFNNGDGCSQNCIIEKNYHCNNDGEGFTYSFPFLFC